MKKSTHHLPKIKVTYNAPVTLSFVILCTIIMLLDSYVLNHQISGILLRIPGGKASAHPFNWKSVPDYIRLFTHCLGHASWSHLIANMGYLLLLGPILEDRYGSKMLALMMVTTSLVTGVINACFITTPEMGASDIVFMMIILTSFTTISKNEIPLSFILVFALYIGGQFYNASTLKADSISVVAHIAGGLCGSLFAFLVTPKSPATRSTSRRKTDDDDIEELDDDPAGPSPRSAKQKKVKRTKQRKSGNDDETVVGTLEF